MLLVQMETPTIPIADFEKVGCDWLNKFRASLSAKTTVRRLTTLKEFSRWAGVPGIFDEYKPPVPAATIPQPLPIPRMENVMRMIDVAKSSEERALIAILGFLGTRISEALSLTPRSLSLPTRELTIRGKGDKVRIIPVSSAAMEYIMPLYVERFVVSAEMPLILMCDRSARSVVPRLAREAGFTMCVSSRHLRATFATWLLEKTGDLRLVQEFMGHANVTTTEVYTLVERGRMRSAVEVD